MARSAGSTAGCTSRSGSRRTSGGGWGRALGGGRGAAAAGWSRRVARSAGSTAGCTSRSGSWRTSGACWARALERDFGTSGLTAKDFAALISLGALWGASFLFIRVAVPALGPFVLVGLRVGLAALVLVLVAAAPRRAGAR